MLVKKILEGIDCSSGLKTNNNNNKNKRKRKRKEIYLVELGKGRGYDDRRTSVQGEYGLRKWS